MTTNKQRVQAYIERSLFDAFESERTTWNVSQSQALERILAERYGVEPILDKQQSRSPLEERLEQLEKAFNEFRIKSLVAIELLEKRLSFYIRADELPSESNSESPIVVNKLPSESNSESLVVIDELRSESNSESPLIVDELRSESNSESPLIVDELRSESNSESPLIVDELRSESNSESPLIVDELPSESNSESPLIVDELPSESDSESLIVDELPSESDSESLIVDELPSESDSESLDSLVVESELPSESGSKLPVVDDELPSELASESPTVDPEKLYVICLFNTIPPADPNNFEYFGGKKNKRFSPSLVHATKYKSQQVAFNRVEKLMTSGTYPSNAGWEIRVQTLAFFEQKEKAKLATLSPVESGNE